MGSRCGCGPDRGSPRPGRTEWAQPPASGEENEGRRWPRTPREEGCGEQALWSRVPGKSSGVPHLWGMAGGPRSRQRALPSCLAGEAAGSAEPTPAHTLPKSMLSAALGTSCRVASLQAPSQPGARKVGGGGARESEAQPPPVAHWCPPSSFPALPLLDPRSFSRRQPPGLVTEAWMSFPAPQGQVRGRVAEGLAVRPPAGCTCSPCACQAHGPRAVSRLGGRGCVSARTLAHTLAVTHKAVVS